MEITLEIHDLSRGGPGVGRDGSGKIVFVPFSAPGDLLRVEIQEEDKRYSEAKILEILKPSSLRVEPPCPAYGKCGGCEWQHIPYSLQWSSKVKSLKHGLQRVNVNPESAPWEEFPAEKIWEYRNRVQLRGFRNEIGFYERSSKRLVPIEKCWIARPELNAQIPDTRAAGKDREREYKVELEVFPDGATTSTWNSGHSASGFRQVHDEQNKKLQDWVSTHLRENELLLDLYGGSGNLSLDLASRFSEIHSVDYGAPESQSKENFTFHRAPVFPWLRKNEAMLAQTKKKISVVFDPPREGLGEDLIPIIEILKRLHVVEILAIGCDPDPWIRLVQRFQKHGWAIESFGALDFFPQTHHIESLAVFRKPL